MKTTQYFVGERVAFNCSIDGYRPLFAMVEKISKTGTLTLSTGRRFNKGGRELKSNLCNYPSAKMITVEAAERYLAQKEKNSKTQEQVRGIQKFLVEQKTGYGEFYVTPENKATLLAMVEALSPNQD